eukprot:CAMPEP_0176072000 /NCGR_PEP_ID=MMETSP0120_2-20121206/35964_1 /TAXON_ID=160619 /ORGANISM="Kryptoperidinium foliaceum, Strain CCMP 1326" /LENGTH=95 /DNA_ID=CAMNT_0017405661 /DNA_START=30 /DNA_END=314 /DNA_ORIENTATION=-
MVFSHFAKSTIFSSSTPEADEFFSADAILAFFRRINCTEASHSTRWKKSCVNVSNDNIGAMKSNRSFNLSTEAGAVERRHSQMLWKPFGAVRATP